MYLMGRHRYLTFLVPSFVLILQLEPGLADSEGNNMGTHSAKEVLMKQFVRNIDSINDDLKVNSGSFITNPTAFHRFLIKRVSPHWNAKSTMRALLGKSVFDNLSLNERESLAKELERTWRRYAHEGIKHYSGQEFLVRDVSINQKGDRGWVKILIASKLLPDIFIDLLVKKDLGEDWNVVDIRFKGITYVSVRKNAFREVVAKRSASALEAQLFDKNQTYFFELCNRTSWKGLPPC